MKLNIWKMIEAGGWILAIALLVFSVTRPGMVSSGIIYLPICAWLLYWGGRDAANENRRAEVTDTTLSLWKRRILFLGQPNPFRRKTVVFQTTLVIGTAILVVAWLIAPYTIVSLGATLVWIAAMPIMVFICEIRGRRK